MLDREEERRLAEIEARLRVEDPELHDLFARAPAARPSRPRSHPHPSPDDHLDQPADPIEPPTQRMDPLDELDALDPLHEIQPERVSSHDALDHPSRRWNDGHDFDARVATPPGVLGSIVRTFVAIMAAIALTTAVTLTLGPDVGGFVSVVAFCLAGMYGYQTLRGCPGLRRAREQG